MIKKRAYCIENEDHIALEIRNHGDLGQTYVVTIYHERGTLDIEFEEEAFFQLHKEMVTKVKL